MQELASRRIANASISAKRQVWIDELRKDVAKYLSIWQEISYRWDAVVNKPREGAISDEELAAFSQPIAQMRRSEEHTSELQSLMRISYAVFCLKKKKKPNHKQKESLQIHTLI